MGALKEYDPKQVNITWDGIDLNKGIIAGTFITIARNTRTFSVNVGADGGGTRIRSNDKSAVITLSLRKGSETNSLLTDRLLDEELPNPVGHVAPMMIKDNTGNTLHEGAQTFLDGPPDDAFGNEEETVEWTFLCLDLSLKVRGSKEAPVT